MKEPVPAIRSVVVERTIAAPPEKIWRALTQPHLIAEWLMQNDFVPTPGHRFQLQRAPKPEVKVVIDCEVLAVEPNQTLSYSWAAFGLESTVTFTLTETPEGTLLRVEQVGFRPDQSAAFGGARVAWRGFLASLDDLLKRVD